MRLETLTLLARCARSLPVTVGHLSANLFFGASRLAKVSASVVYTLVLC